MLRSDSCHKLHVLTSKTLSQLTQTQTRAENLTSVHECEHECEHEFKEPSMRLELKPRTRPRA